jgi:hypothetical protein
MGSTPGLTSRSRAPLPEKLPPLPASSDRQPGHHLETARHRRPGGRLALPPPPLRKGQGRKEVQRARQRYLAGAPWTAALPPQRAALLGGTGPRNLTGHGAEGRRRTSQPLVLDPGTDPPHHPDPGLEREAGLLPAGARPGRPRRHLPHDPHSCASCLPSIRAHGKPWPPCIPT